MEGNRKHILDRFQEHLSESYETWCERHGVEKSDGRLVTFLIDHDLIPAAHIQRYAVLREFDKMSGEPYFQKTQTVTSLAHRFNISERTVWNIIKQDKSSGGKKR